MNGGGIFMGVKMTVKGLEEYIQKLEKLGDKGKEMARRSLYEGAGVMADKIKSSINNIPTRSEESDPKSTGMQSGITPTQKQGLTDGFGITKMITTSTGVNVRIGFAGKNADGKSNASVAAAAESGRSWVQPTHFFSQAVNSSTGAAQSAMQQEFDKQIRQVMP